MKMQFGVMFCYGPLIILWILFADVARARHIQLATQRTRPQSRPRLLIIRPPEGSGQPNRIVVLANSRPKPTNPSPSLSTAITALQETSAAAQAGLDRAFGGHPQSIALQQARSGGRTASQKSSSAPKASTPDTSKKDSASSPISSSLRDLLRSRSRVHRNHGTVGDNTRPNIFRGFPNIPPRAAAPVVPQAKSMGRLNMPEKLQRRLQEQAKNRPNLRQSNIQAPYNHHEHMGGGRPAVAQPSSPFHGGVIDLSTVSLHERGQAPDATSGDAGRPSGANLRWDIGTLRAPGNLGRNGISQRAGTAGSWSQNQSSGSRKDPFVKNNDLLQMPIEPRRGAQNAVRNTGSNLRTFQDPSIKSGAGTVPAPSAVDIQSMLRESAKPKSSFDLSNTVGVGQTSSRGSGTPMTSKQPLPTLEKSPTSNIPAASGSRDTGSNRFRMKHPIPAPPSVVPPVSAGKSLKLNATAKHTSTSAETNSTSNTTNTKSVKTKKVQITTVVKGGTQADVAAAAASQAEIANAVAQGKEINSSALANLAKAASSGAAKANAPVKNTPPVGSITVKRQPNGESIITLSDGQGEPVVLRATGPVKIERIVKPNGRVQFLINPLDRPTTTAAVIDTTAAVVDLSELEAEEITTTTSMTSTGLWSTSTPFYVDPSAVTASTAGPLFEPTGKSPSVPGNAPIKSTVEVTSNTNTSSSSSSQNSTTVTKNRTRTITANTETNGIMQLFPSQKIPPPPKLSGMSFGNSGLFNPFFLDTNNFLQNSGFSLGANEAVQSSGSTKMPSAKGTDKAPLQLFPDVGTSQPLQRTRGQSGNMPQYELLGVTQSLQFVPSGNVVP